MPGQGTTDGGLFRYPYEYTTVADLLNTDHAEFIARHMDRDRALEDFLSNLSFPDGFITVAAADTPDIIAEGADYTCTGTADDVVIQEALDDNPGCQIILMAGTFNTTSTILIDQDEALIGSGHETTVITYTGSDYAIRVPDPPGAANGDFTLAHMTIGATAVNGACLDVMAGAPRGLIFDCFFVASGATSTNRAVFLKAGCFFTKNRVDVGGDYYALLISGDGNYRIIDNIFVGPVAFDSLELLTFSLNLLYQAPSGTKSAISTGATSLDNIEIIANHIESTRGHGIETDGVGLADSSIMDNVIKGVGAFTANTYDGIHLVGNANVVQGNVIRGTSHRYAIYTAAASSLNWITNNYIPVGGTGSLFDAGIASVTTPGNYPGGLGTAAIPATTITAKGDLIVGTGASTYDNLPVGSNGTTLLADSAETMGMRWGLPEAECPTYLSSGQVFYVPQYRQELYIDTIELDGGILDVVGTLIEVSQPPDMSGYVYMEI